MNKIFDLKLLHKNGFIIASVFLLVIYFAIGLFNIFTTPITGDELAHLSGAHGISQGQAVNIEHPVFLKLLNGLAIQIFYPDYLTSSDGQWSRSLEFTLQGPYKPYDIIQTSRLVYLIFNSLLIFWLIRYANKGWISNEFSLIFSILYIFSPSLASQNFLLLFDIAGGQTLLISILGYGLLAWRQNQLSNKEFTSELIIHSIILAMAINIKFSNVAVLPILVVFLLGVWLWQKSQETRTKIIKSGWIIFTTITGLSYLFFAYSYRNSPTPWPNYLASLAQTDWLAGIFYITGLLMTLDRSQSLYYNFVDDRLLAITYPEFINRVFWYKENPMVTILILISTFLGIFCCYQQRHLLTKNNLKKYQNYLGYVAVGIFFIGFPAIYMWSARNTTFTIGYRHFYPVLIFIYAGIAGILGWVLKNIKIYKITILKQALIKNIIFLTLFAYVGFGLLAIPQGIRYINFYWTKEPWQLATDSTVSWGEGEGLAIKFLLENNLLKINGYETDANSWNIVFDSNSGPNIHIHLSQALPKGIRINDVGSFFQDLRQKRISEIAKTYLIIDFGTIQRLYLNKDTNEIAMENFQYLERNQPIWNLDGVVKIYKIN